MPAFLLNVIYKGKPLTQTNKTYASFNALTIQGRIANVDLATFDGNEFIAVTIISNLMNDDEGVTIKFTNSNGLKALYEKGFLPVGRMVTVTGHIKSISETYTNKSGEVVMLKRPQISLVDAQIPTGGLGPLPAAEDAPRRRVGAAVKPADASKQTAPIDDTPVF